MTRDAPGARATVEGIAASRIREVFDYGQQFSEVVPLWFGEPDAVTPSYIRDAAKASLDAGDTFYSSNLGIGPLREAIARYLSHWRRPLFPGQVAVTGSGVSALSLAAQLLIEPGDRVVVVDPVWPNLVEIPRILSARVERVSLEVRDGRWTLDVERLIAKLAPRVRALWINSPGNPTGFVVERDAIRAILEHCRRQGTWIVSDDVYERLYYPGGQPDGADGSSIAPSVLDICTADDRVVSTNSFSKTWAMTGWRLGWMVVPESLLPALGKLIEYNTSCAPVFVQHAAITAIEHGEPFVRQTVARYRAARDYAFEALSALPRIHATSPAGAMYLFFRVAGETDSLALAKRLVREARVGLAPGIAFGPSGEGYLRLCFACTTERLQLAAERLARALRA